MATTSLWRVKGHIRNVVNYAENAEKTSVESGAGSTGMDNQNRTDSLDQLIAYAAREEATNLRQLVTGLNCNPERATIEMNAVKQKFGKTGGTIAYHGYQSFREGEVTPEQAHQIGIRLAEELWGDRYQVIVATHLDKQSHIHSHFVINTVSFVDGKKFYRSKEDYRRMQLVSDRLCREEKLSVIRKKEAKGKDYSEWDAERQGKPTYSAMIRADIDRAITASVTEDEFYDYLEEIGYEFKFYSANGKLLERPSLKPRGSERFFRFDRLGEDYYLEDILARVVTKMRRKLPFPEEEQRAFEKYYKENPPKTEEKGLARDYYIYAYKVKAAMKFPSAIQVVTQSMREDIIKLDKLDQDVRFLSSHHIRTYEELKNQREESEKKLQTLSEDRNQLRDALKQYLRDSNQEAAEETRGQIRKLTEEISKMRLAVKICNRVEKRSIEAAGGKERREGHGVDISEKTVKTERMPQSGSKGGRV